MVVSLKPELERLVEQRVKAGLFDSAEELVNAAVEEFIGDAFAPGEMEALLAVGAEQAKAGKFVDGDEVFAKLKARSDARRNRS